MAHIEVLHPSVRLVLEAAPNGAPLVVRLFHILPVYPRLRLQVAHVVEQLLRETQVTADAIAASLGMAGDDENRVAAGIDYALQQISTNGHCCIPEQPLIDRTAKLLRVDPLRVGEVLKKQLKLQRLAVESVGGTTLIYSPYLYRAEKKGARKLL